MAKVTLVAEYTYDIPDDLLVRHDLYDTTDLDECIAIDLKNADTIFDMQIIDYTWGEDPGLSFSIYKAEEE